MYSRLALYWGACLVFGGLPCIRSLALFSGAGLVFGGLPLFSAACSLVRGAAEEKVLMSNIIDQVACAKHSILYISISRNGFQLLTQFCVVDAGSGSLQRVAVFETV